MPLAGSLNSLLKVLEDFSSAFPNFFVGSIEKFPNLLESEGPLSYQRQHIPNHRRERCD